MNIGLTELIVSQTKTLGVMFCAGILVEMLWQLKKGVQKKLVGSAEKGSISIGIIVAKYAAEAVFWAAAAASVSMFLYYCAYGKPSVHAAIGFFAGLLLWKKTCCDIIKTVWVENDEAESLKTTARSSVSKRPENKGWTKDGRKRKKKRNV